MHRVFNNTVILTYTFISVGFYFTLNIFIIIYIDMGDYMHILSCHLWSGVDSSLELAVLSY